DPLHRGETSHRWGQAQHARDIRRCPVRTVVDRPHRSAYGRRPRPGACPCLALEGWLGRMESLPLVGGRDEVAPLSCAADPSPCRLATGSCDAIDTSELQIRIRL